jgi:hypothetical protein
MDIVANASRTLLIEANAVTDNPLLFPKMARFSRAVTSTPSRSPLPPTRWRWPSPKSARCPSAASRC